MPDESRRCPACGQVEDHDHDPRHVIVGVGVRDETVITGDGRRLTIPVPYDAAFHFDCHAALGCEHCAGMLAAHDGSVKGKAQALAVPEHLEDGAQFVLVGPHGAVVRHAGQEAL